MYPFPSEDFVLFDFGDESDNRFLARSSVKPTASISSSAVLVLYRFNTHFNGFSEIRERKKGS